jgi:hypothetical protein
MFIKQQQDTSVYSTKMLEDLAAKDQIISDYELKINDLISQIQSSEATQDRFNALEEELIETKSILEEVSFRLSNSSRHLLVPVTMLSPLIALLPYLTLR